MAPLREQRQEDEPSGSPTLPATTPDEPVFFAEEFAEAEAPFFPPEPAWLLEQLDHSPLSPEVAWGEQWSWKQDWSTPPEPAWDDPIWQGTDWEPDLIRVQPHPTEEWQALTWRIHSQWREQVQVWTSSSNHLVWHPEGAVLLVWSPRGEQVAIIREQPRPDPRQPYAFERYTWPELALVGRCPLRVPAGWPYALGLWPRDNLAVFAWTDQDQEGLAWIRLSVQGDHQEQERWISPDRERESMRVFLESLLETEDRQELYWTFWGGWHTPNQTMGKL